MIRRQFWVSPLVAAVVVLGSVACGGSKPDAANEGAATSTQSVDLHGAGATFPYPIYSKWFADYAKATGVRINYQSIGSGGGIRQLSEGTVDFGASDSPMSDEELSRAKGGAILHIPTVLGAVVVTYNLPTVTEPLNLSAPLIADIFLGTVKKWNDARIAAENPGVTLPNQDILVVYRSDGSGTTYIFSDYLTATSPVWKERVGRGKELKWPVGLGGKGNEGVAGQVKQLPGAVSFVELAYAKHNNLAYANVKNSAGVYVRPTLESVTAAAEGMMSQVPESTDFRISVVNAPGQNTYPISSMTWLLVYQQQTDAAKAKKLVDFMTWALQDGKTAAAALDYAPLPDRVTQILLKRLATITQ